MQRPAVGSVSVPPGVMVQIAGVAELKLTVNSESAVAVSVGLVPTSCGPGLLKLMVWEVLGITAFEAEDGAPVPAELVAVTVKVYSTPLARPVTIAGELAAEPVNPPGLDVAV